MFNKLMEVYKIVTAGIDRPADYATNPKWHDLKWHAYSIVEHSVKFAELAAKETDDQTILVAALLHDIGKFVSPWSEQKQEFRHGNHAELGGELLDKHLDKIKTLFPAEEIKWDKVRFYIVNHFALGEVRKAAKANGGYNVEFATSQACRDACVEIINRIESADWTYNPEVIGRFFLYDCLSKVNECNLPEPAFAQTETNYAVYETYVHAYYKQQMDHGDDGSFDMISRYINS